MPRFPEQGRARSSSPPQGYKGMGSVVAGRLSHLLGITATRDAHLGLDDTVGWLSGGETVLIANSSRGWTGSRRWQATPFIYMGEIWERTRSRPAWHGGASRADRAGHERADRAERRGQDHLAPGGRRSAGITRWLRLDRAGGAGSAGVRVINPLWAFSVPCWLAPAGSARLRWRAAEPRSAMPVGYGVIGSPTGSGPVSLGSSPGTPAGQRGRAMRPRLFSHRRIQRNEVLGWPQRW